jgi:hypothetical protein
LKHETNLVRRFAGYQVRAGRVVRLSR